MSYTLYYSPGAASMAVHWMLIELRVPFDVCCINIDEGMQHSPDYRRLNPTGRVPTLVVDGVPRHESTALLMLLAERHPEGGFAPPPGTPERAAWFELMIYLANTLLPAMRNWFYADIDGDPDGADAVRAHARLQIEAAMDEFDGRLRDGRNHLLGGASPSTADFLAIVLMRWTRNMPRTVFAWPHLARYVERMRARPSFAELTAREGLTEWLNAPVGAAG
ncbi:glutathione S-transferase family protein [Burkholderia sp. BDU5]|uniref:glutathione S-transferase family protein n=1 Tax=Burkholderia sp. BDU5 TaxID=1385590 RepID=UPI000751EACE|nr:glutathione S-transferase family protein [Burkholderia sp. BDU5]KVE43309.1 glutathione S-transferase [Burkholderia sp. BDU5]